MPALSFDTVTQLQIHSLEYETKEFLFQTLNPCLLSYIRYLKNHCFIRAPLKI